MDLSIKLLAQMESANWSISSSRLRPPAIDWFPLNEISSYGIASAVLCDKYRWLAVLVDSLHRRCHHFRATFAAWDHRHPNKCCRPQSSAPILLNQTISYRSHSRFHLELALKLNWDKEIGDDDELNCEATDEISFLGILTVRQFNAIEDID